MADVVTIVRVVIDCAASFEARKSKMGITGFCDKDFNEQNFPIASREGQKTFEMLLVRSLGEEEGAVQGGWERAKVEHVMAYAAHGWDRKTWVVARGSSCRDDDGFLVVPTLRSMGNACHLFVDIDDGLWLGIVRFLVVRKCA